MGEEIRYCFVCGTALVEEYLEGHDRWYCPSCDQIRYRNPKPAAGTLLIDENSLLLIERTEPPGSGSWSIHAGYLEYDEPPETAAVRELHEETSLTVPEETTELFDTGFVEHPNGQHVLVLVYVASADYAIGELKAGDDAADAKFWTIADLREQDEDIEPGYVPIFENAADTFTDSNQ